jgi:hypothetical protein
MQQPVLELPVALHIMVFDPGMTAAQLAAERTTVRATALIDLGIANDRLAEARAGIRLELAPANIQVGATMAEFSIADCVDADNPAKDLDVDGMLNVYYVDLVGTTSAFGSLRGTTCPWQEGRPEVIYVNRNDWVPSTLAHEVGHALGLTVPRDGHTEVMKEFDLTNLMMCCNVGQDRLARTRLTVGQVFRMNADSGSWLNWASPGGTPIRPGPRVACQCGRDDPAGLCPRLAEDVATPNTTPSQIHDRDCYDRLEFTSMPAGSETPVAIVAGRRWRMPPAKMGDLTNCRWVPGPSETLFGAVAVRFDNLTRPGKCPSWAAIFFDTHGPLFLELDEAVVRWTQSGDERRLGTLAPPPPRTVTVHLRYEQDDQDKVDDDKTHMLETFGEPNHVGIKLALTETSVANNVGVTCPPVTAPQELNLCYMDVGTTEGQWEGASRRITVWLNHRTPTSASHFVGQALGLSPLGPAELAAAPADGYEGNIMRSLPANRDKRLTLGQVYRINAALGVLAPCPANSMNCPVLHADVPR